MSKPLLKSRDYRIVEGIKNAIPMSREACSLRNELFKQYLPLVYKMKRNLIGRATKTSLIIDHEVDEYEALAFEKLEASLLSTDLKKIKDPGTYFHYIQFYGYLRSMNRDLIAHRIKLCNTEVAIRSASEIKEDGSVTPSKVGFIEDKDCGRARSAEDESLEDMKKAVINRAVDYCIKRKFTNLQKEIFKLKTSDATIRAITEELQIKSPTYYKELNNIRDILKSTLKTFCKEEKIDLELSYF